MSHASLGTRLCGLKLWQPLFHRDTRGSVCELWGPDLATQLGVDACFDRILLSHSMRGTLRGLHFQSPAAQPKLVHVLSGSIFDVVVDLRKHSPTFGEWESFELSDANGLVLCIPPGFAHGYFCPSVQSSVLYHIGGPRLADAEHRLLWNDPDLAIPWPIPQGTHPILSTADAAAQRLENLAHWL